MLSNAGRIHIPTLKPRLTASGLTVLGVLECPRPHAAIVTSGVLAKHSRSIFHPNWFRNYWSCLIAISTRQRELKDPSLRGRLSTSETDLSRMFDRPYFRDFCDATQVDAYYVGHSSAGHRTMRRWPHRALASCGKRSGRFWQRHPCNLPRG